MGEQGRGMWVNKEEACGLTNRATIISVPAGYIDLTKTSISSDVEKRNG